MQNRWTEEIVYATTEDGLVHAGAAFSPSGVETRQVAVVLVHGIGGSFSYSAYTGIARELASRGYTCVAGNNRGHDYAYGPTETANGERKLQGSGWERFSESPYDMAAWIDFAVGLGFGRIVLFGHSYGAFKSVYYQARKQDKRIAGIVLGSPPLSAAYLAQLPLVALAESMVSQGRGRDLLPWDIIPWGAGTISAETYMDAYRVGIDVFGALKADPELVHITCPMLAFYGTEEPKAGGPAELEIIKRNARASRSVETRMVEGADHNYYNCEKELADIVGDWLDREM